MYAAIDRFRNKGDGTIVKLHPSQASRKRKSGAGTSENPETESDAGTAGNSETEPEPPNAESPVTPEKVLSPAMSQLSFNFGRSLTVMTNLSQNVST